MANKIKVVVTGGAGFIGSNLVDALVERGYNVHVVDNLVAGKREHVNSKAVFYEADIRNVEDLKKIFEGARGVFHLAALPRIQYSIDFPLESNEVNVTGTLNVFLAAQSAGVRKVVYSASSSAYGDQETLPVMESMPALPKSPYALQKYVGELYAKVWNEIYGLETVSLRYFNIYGPRQSEEGAYSLVIAKFLKQKREGEPLSITGDGEQTRDFTHVRDAVRANILAMENSNVGKGEVINIGAGRNISINKIAELIGGKTEYIPLRLEIRHNRADNSLAKKLLGWEPTVSIEDGIVEFLV